jgi:hypothetical protein
VVAVDGSKFKAVNNRDKNYTPTKLQRRIEQVEESIARYMSAMDAADRQEDEVAQAKSTRLKDKITALREQVRQFRVMEQAIEDAPDRQVSLTDPDARSMATSGKGTGVVGYNVQAAVDTRHHLIVAHEVTNKGHDRGQLSGMARQAREAMGPEAITVIADCGYYKGEDILLCEQGGATPLVPKPLTSGAKADGRFGKQDFVYLPEEDVYRCPAGQIMKWSFNRVDEHGMTLRYYATPGVRIARSRPSARPPKCAGSGAGSMRPCWMPRSAGSTKRRTVCAFVGKPWSTRSAR